MKKPELDEFGRIFIKEVRDYVLEDFEKIFAGKMKGAQAKSLFEYTNRIRPARSY